MVAQETDILNHCAVALPEARQVLVFAPHPDDEIFGCGGALALLREQKIPVSVIIATNGAAGGDDPSGDLTQIRSQESRDAAALLGLSEPVFWGCPDRGLAYGEKLIEKAMEVISRLDADLVFLPSPTELHPDHQVLAFAGLEALRRLGGDRRAVFYEINLPLPNPNLLVDISRVAAQKMAAMHCFPSQLKEQPYDRRIEGLNRFRSYFLGAEVSHAEAFLLVEAAALVPDLISLFEGPLTYRQRLGFAADGAGMPLVSIVVRSMNRPALSRALDSLALQTWPNCEVVVVNARGGEHTDLQGQCGRFPLRLINQGGGSLPRSRAANLGLAACRGDYLCFLDDDDSMDADHLYHLVETLQKQSGRCIAYAGVRGMNERSRDVMVEFREPEISFTRLLLGNAIPIHAALFPAELVKQGAHFDEAFDLYEDWDFWLQLARKVPFVFVDRISATYYAGGGSGAGLASAADETVKQQGREKLLAAWLPRLTPPEFDAVSDLYRLTRDRLIAEQELLRHTIAVRDGEIAWRDGEIAVRDQEIARRNEEIAGRDWEITVREALLSELYASRSWKLSAPLRWLSEQMRKFRQLLP